MSIPYHRGDDVDAPRGRPAGARSIETRDDADRPGPALGLDWVRSGLGVAGLFASLGVGLFLLAFAAAYPLRGLDLDQPLEASALALPVLLGILPLVAGPLLATMGGIWAGTRTGDAGQGAAAGALGTLVGIVVMLFLAGFGFAFGVAAAGVDLAGVNWPTGILQPGWQTTLGYFGTAGGLLYLVACVLVGALSGAVAGGLVDRFGFGWTRETRVTGRRQAPRI